MEYEYRERRDQRESTKDIKVLVGFFLVICLLFGMLYGAEIKEEMDHKTNNEVKVTMSSEELQGIDYEDAVKSFESAGFNNIKLDENKDLIFGLISKKGEVESVTINGDKEFSEGEWFPADATVKITYHAYKK
jgi:hypothetical protein